jgi:hypothetical protein
MVTRKAASAWLSIAAIFCATAWFVRFLWLTERAPRVGAYDIYAYFVPVMIHAVEAIRHGGSGMF